MHLLPLTARLSFESCSRLTLFLGLGFINIASAAENKRALSETEIGRIVSIAPGALEAGPASNRARTASRKGAAGQVKLVALLHDEKALAGIHDVQLQGNYAYVTGKGPDGTIKEGKGSFAIIDISDPRKPLLTGSLTQGITNGETVLLDHDVCYIGSHHFWSVDVRDKSNPQVLAKIEDSAIRSINGMTRLGDYLYAASKNGHVTVFDIRDSRKPKLASAYRTKGAFGSPHDIDRLGDERVVVVNIQAQKGQEQLRVYKAAHPKTGAPLPQEEWQLEGVLDDQRLRGANRVRVRNKFAFVMCNKGYAVGVVDLRNTARPVLTDWYSTTDDPRYKSCGMDLAGEVMIAAGSGVIGLFDISALPQLRKIGEYEFDNPIPGKDVVYRQEQSVLRLQYLVSPDHDLVYRDGFLYTSDQEQNVFAVFEVVDPELRRRMDR